VISEGEKPRQGLQRAHGMLEAQGRIVLLPTGLSAPIEEADQALGCPGDHDVAIAPAHGSSLSSSSVSFSRVRGIVFNAIVRLTCACLRDTQCGFKASVQPCHVIFEQQTIERSGSTRAALSGAASGLRAAEFPVRWPFAGNPNE